MNPSIQTFTGILFDVANPNPINVDIIDIAHGLAHVCRFGGHTSSFYSVAQHSVMVSTLVPKHLARAALLHDAAEAYLGDVPTPIKRVLPDYEALYRGVEYEICVAFGLFYGWTYGDEGYPEPLLIAPEIKRADMVALATEKRDLLLPGVWEVDAKPLPGPIVPWAPAEAKERFLMRWREVNL